MIYWHYWIDGPFVAAGRRRLFVQDHGIATSLGFRSGQVAYANDCATQGDDAFEVMTGVDVLVVDAIRSRPIRPTPISSVPWNGSAGSPSGGLFSQISTSIWTMPSQID